MSDFKCAVTKWGERDDFQLEAAAFIPEGAVILREQPLISVPVGIYVNGTYTWDLVDCVLSNPRIRDTYYSWRLKRSEFFTDPRDVEVEKRLAKKHKIPRPMVKALYFSVATNNIAHFDDEKTILGYGLYQLLSRVNHSCSPNATLIAGDAKTGELGLLANQDIQPGEAVTWDYFQGVEADGTPFGELDFESRNFNLVNAFGFLCQCERCWSEYPDHLKDLDLMKYFQDKIRQEAEKIVAREMAVGKTGSMMIRI